MTKVSEIRMSTDGLSYGTEMLGSRTADPGKVQGVDVDTGLFRDAIGAEDDPGGFYKRMWAPTLGWIDMDEAPEHPRISSDDHQVDYTSFGLIMNQLFTGFGDTTLLLMGTSTGIDDPPSQPGPGGENWAKWYEQIDGDEILRGYMVASTGGDSIGASIYGGPSCAATIMNVVGGDLDGAPPHSADIQTFIDVTTLPGITPVAGYFDAQLSIFTKDAGAVDDMWEVDPAWGAPIYAYTFADPVINSMWVWRQNFIGGGTVPTVNISRKVPTGGNITASMMLLATDQ
jgi:hypothetical protein